MTADLPNRKRVLHVLPSLNMGGIEKGVVESCATICEQGYEFDFLIEDSAAPQDLTADVLDFGGHIYEAGSFHALLRFPFKFLRHVSRNGPYDVVHAHPYHFSGLVMVLAFLSRIPVRVAHAHSNRQNLKNNLITTIYKHLLMLLINVFSTKVLAVSAEAAMALTGGDVTKKIDKNRVFIQPLGINFGAFKTPINSNNILRDAGINQDRRYLVHIGRFSAEKNHVFLLDLLEHMIVDHDELDLLLIGNGPLRDDIERLAADRGLTGRVIFAGMRRDCPAILRSVKGVFVLPSHFEGFGLVAAEAQAAGLKVVVSTGVPESVDIVPENIVHIALSEPLSRWGQLIEAGLSSDRKDPESALADAESSAVAMGRYVALLAKIYG
jgi:glycosyltransferase involved in cell wall biosynthesis